MQVPLSSYEAIEKFQELGKKLDLRVEVSGVLYSKKLNKGIRYMRNPSINFTEHRKPRLRNPIRGFPYVGHVESDNYWVDPKYGKKSELSKGIRAIFSYYIGIPEKKLEKIESGGQLHILMLDE